MMADYDDFDEDAAQRTNNAPYTARHPIPTVQCYQGTQEERQEQANAQAPATESTDSVSGGRGLLDSAKRHLHLGKSSTNDSIDEDHPYPSSNRNVEHAQDRDGEESYADRMKKQQEGSQDQSSSVFEDTSEAIGNALDPKAKRKQMKHMQRDHASREVTDPITHLRVTIHDSTSKELETVPENEPAPGTDPRHSATASKDQVQIDQETQEQQAQHRGMEKVFPPPRFDVTREEISDVYALALGMGLGFILLIMLCITAVSSRMSSSSARPRSLLLSIVVLAATLIIAGALGACIIQGLRSWLRKRISAIWEDEMVRDSPKS